ncbi:protein of unknown function [Agreia sp. COWG]|nr:protein of unknown function [Agreia sp. COWG]
MSRILSASKAIGLEASHRVALRTRR